VGVVQSLDIVGLASLQEAGRDFAGGSWDEWANDRTSLWVNDLGPYLDQLATAAQPNPQGFLMADGSAAAGSPTEPSSADRSADDDGFVPTWVTRFDGAVYSVVIDLTPVGKGWRGVQDTMFCSPL
jgi:hypothetical protein